MTWNEIVTGACPPSGIEMMASIWGQFCGGGGISGETVTDPGAVVGGQVPHTKATET